MPENAAGYVYIIQCREFYKIGCALNPRSRLKDIQCSNPYPVRLVAALRVVDRYRAESGLHRHFEAKRERGEWFRLTPQDIAKLIAGVRIPGLRKGIEDGLPTEVLSFGRRRGESNYDFEGAARLSE